MRTYEIMLILPPEAEDSVVEGVTNRISQTLAERGGEVTKSERWGKRRLAYQLAKQTEGLYVIVQCTADPDGMAELDRVLSLADDVVRFKVVVRPAA